MMEYVVTYTFLLINLIICIFSYKLLTDDEIRISLKRMILLLVIALISLIIRYVHIGVLIIISNFCFIFLLNKIFFKINNYKAIYYDLVITLISLFSDGITSLFVSKNYLFNIKVFQNNFYIRSLLNVPVDTLIILISSIPIIKILTKKFYEKYFSKIKCTKTVILFISAIVMILCLAFCFNAYNELDRIGHLLIMSGIIVLFFMLLIILYLLYREYQIKTLNKNIIEENKYIKEIAKQDAEFKHNLINNLLGIKTVSNKRTNKLIDCLIEEYQLDYKNITNINDLPNGVQSIIYRKAYEENIEDLNLIVHNFIKNELYDLLTPKKYNHLCTSVGILFDNALEAVKNTFEKVIEINFEEDQEYIYFILKNSFSNILDLEEIGKRNFTTKSKGHGIGLNYVKNLKTLEIKNEIINNTFIAKIKLKKAKKYRT